MLEQQEILNSFTNTIGLSRQYCTNILANVSGRSLQDSMNIWAGTSDLSIQDAVNIRAGTTNLRIQEALWYMYQNGVGQGIISVDGTVDGTNNVFVFSNIPKIIIVDGGRMMQKVSSDGTVNWTGTTTITLTIAPNFDIFGIGSVYKQITGTVDGSNKSFTSIVAPQALVVDYGNVIKPTSSDSTVNWTGTTSQSLTIAPQNDIFGLSSVLTPASGTIDGSNTTFVFSSTPKILIVDYGRAMQKVSSDGTVNWTGTTTVSLTIAPNFDIIGL